MGLGDVVEKVTEVTGIKAMVHGLTDDCGCTDRKNKLNAMFPFYNPMTDDQKAAWEVIRVKWEGQVLTADEQRIVNAMYNEVFRGRAKFSRCGSCVARRMKALEDVYQLCAS
jgi:hypothetical protein